MNLDFNPKGQLQAVKICSWTTGLALWRTELDDPNGLMRAGFYAPDLVVLSMWFGDQPVDLASLRWSRSQDKRFSVNQSEMFERFSDEFRWVLDRLGIQPASWSPVGGSGSQQDPWLGRFVDLEATRARAVQLDARFKRLRKLLPQFTERNPKIGRYGGTFQALMEKEDPGLDHDLAKFFGPPWLEAGPARWMKEPGAHEPTLMDIGRIPWQPKSIDHDDGGFDLDVLRPVHPDSSAGHFVQSWRGTSLVKFVEWLQDLEDHPSWVVLPADRHAEQIRLHTLAGTFTLGPEEVRLYGALGEDLPYLWERETFVRWAVDRRPL